MLSRLLSIPVDTCLERGNHHLSLKMRFQNGGSVATANGSAAAPLVIYHIKRSKPLKSLDTICFRLTLTPDDWCVSLLLLGNVTVSGRCMAVSPIAVKTTTADYLIAAADAGQLSSEGFQLSLAQNYTLPNPWFSYDWWQDTPAQRKRLVCVREYQDLIW